MDTSISTPASASYSLPRDTTAPMDSSNAPKSSTSPVASSIPSVRSEERTRYHGLFYDLVTWKDARHSGITLGAVLVGIIIFSHVSILSLFFWAMSWALFGGLSLELIGKVTRGGWEKPGFAQQFRPQPVYTIPEDALSTLFDETHGLLNFAFIEIQKLVFNESPVLTFAALVACLISKVAISYVPLWILSSIATILAFSIAPLYLRFQEPIDRNLEFAQQQASQHITTARDFTATHAGKARDTAAQYASVAAEKVGISPQDGSTSRQRIPVSTTAGGVTPTKVSNTSTKPSTTSPTVSDMINASSLDVDSPTTELPRVPFHEPEFASTIIPISATDAETEPLLLSR